MAAKTSKNSTVAEQTEHTVHEQAHQVKVQAQQVAQQGQQAVSHAWELGRTQFRGMLTGQKDKVASSLGDVAAMLHQTGSQMREQGQPGGGKIAETVADRITQISTGIQEKEIEEILADTEDFARSQPVVFLSIAALLGFILARFLKSSGQAAGAA